MTKGEIVDRIDDIAATMQELTENIVHGPDRGKNVSDCAIMLAIGDANGQWDRFIHELIQLGITSPDDSKGDDTNA